MSSQCIAVVRDWAAQSGGADIADFNGPDYSPDCGPAGAIDLSQATGWGSTTGNDDGDTTNVFVPKYVVVELPKTLDISEFGVDPSMTCGDGGSASTGDYSIETSPDGDTGAPVASLGTSAGVPQASQTRPTTCSAQATID